MKTYTTNKQTNIQLENLRDRTLNISAGIGQFVSLQFAICFHLQTIIVYEFLRVYAVSTNYIFKHFWPFKNFFSILRSCSIFFLRVFFPNLHQAYHARNKKHILWTYKQTNSQESKMYLPAHNWQQTILCYGQSIPIIQELHQQVTSTAFYLMKHLSRRSYCQELPARLSCDLQTDFPTEIKNVISSR